MECRARARHRPTVLKTKCASKQLIYMIADFQSFFSAAITSRFLVLLTPKRLTQAMVNNPANILRVDED